MKLRLPLLLAAAVLSACSFSHAVQADTILTFDQITEQNKDLLPTFGSNATTSVEWTAVGVPGYKVEGMGTPNIGIKYTGTWQTWGKAGGVWGDKKAGNTTSMGVAQIESGTSTIRFSPEHYGAVVSLGSFNFIGDTEKDAFKFTVTVAGDQSGVQLFKKSYEWTVDFSKDHTGAPVVDLSGIKGGIGEALVLTFVRDTGNGNNIAVDNIRFSQTGYEGTVLSRTLAEGASASWISEGWKKGNTDTPWTDATASVPVVAELKGGATTGSTILLANTDIRVMDGISVTSGGVTVSGGKISLIGHAVLDISAGAKLNLDTALSVTAGSYKGEPDVVHIEGEGLVVIKKDQVWGNVGGSGNLQLDGNLTITGNNTPISGVALSGSGHVYMNGSGVLRFNKKSTLSGEGMIHANSGTVMFASADWFTGELSKKIDLTSKGMVAFDATVDSIHNLAPIIADGNVKMAFFNTGGTSGGDLGMALDLSKTNYSNEIVLKNGILNLELSKLINKDGKNDFTFILDGGGILSASTKDVTEVTIANDVMVGAAGGYIRDYGSKSSTFTGKIFGSGQLAHEDVGTAIFAGDMSKFTGDFAQNAGSVVFDTGAVAHVNNYKMFSPGGSKTGSLTVLGKMTVDRDLFGGGVVWNSNDTPTLNIGDDKNTQAELTVDKLLFFQSWGRHTINLKSGILNILGTGNNTFYFGDWAYSQGFFNQTGGTLNLLNENIRVSTNGYNGKDSQRAIWNMSNGTANVKGISFAESINGTNRRGELYFTGGRINIGSYGIDALTKAAVVAENTDYKFEAGGATFGALDSWTSKMDMLLKGVVVFDTRGYVADSDTPGFSGVSHTITWDASMKEDNNKGIGSIEKIGPGTLVLTKDNTFTGGVVLKGGCLSIGSINALGAAGKRKLTVIGNGIVLNPGTGSVIDILDIKEGGKLNIGNSSIKNSLSVGTLAGNGVFVMDLFADKTSDLLSFETDLSSANTVTLNLFVNGDVLNKEFTLINKVGAGTIKIASDYRNSLKFAQKIDSGNLKITVSGGFDTQNLIWQNTSPVGTWKVGTSGDASWSGAESGKEGGFFNADNVTFNAPTIVDGTTKYQTINLEGILAPKSVTVTTEMDKNYLFTNVTETVGYLTGEMSLVKNGAGILTIKTETANNYSGKTTVNGGTLEFGKGAFIGTGDIEIKSGATLKVNDFILTNQIKVDGSYALAFSDAGTKDLKDLSNVIWGANSSLIIAKGAVKGTKAMLKEGQLVAVESGGAFDLSGVYRNEGTGAYHFKLELAGQGVLVNGVYTGALFNSGSVVWSYSGIGEVKVTEDAMINVGGGNAAGTYSEGNRYDIDGAINLNGKTLTKMGHGAVYGKTNSLTSTVTGTLRIAEGSFRVENTDFGSADSETRATVEILSGASIAMLSVKTVYADVILNSGNTDLTKEYVARNYSNIFSAGDSGNTANYAGSVILKQGGSVMLGWGSGSVKNSNIAFSGSLGGDGILYVDTTGTAFTDDSDTGKDRIRHLYLGSTVTGIDGIQLVGKSVLQLSTVNSAINNSALKNATINGGLKIVGSDVNIIKIITTGNQAVTYTGLDFGITAGLERGMELRIQPENTTNSQWTTLNDTLGTLQKINLKASGKLTIGGTTNLKVNDDFLIDGEKAEFLLSGGSLNIGKNVEIAGSSNFTLSGNGTRMTVGNDFNLLGANAKVVLSGGSLVVNGRGRMKGGTQFEISGDDTVFESKGINTANKNRGFQLQDQGAVMTINGGTVTLAGKTGIGVGDGKSATGNHGTINQNGGTMNMTDVWMSEWANTGYVSYYNLTKGVMNVSGEFLVGSGGSAELNISGGVANIKKISLCASNADNLRSLVNLSGTGRLNLGSGGLMGSTSLGTGSVKSVNLSGGILGATENWETTAELTLKKTDADPNGVTVDTTLTSGGAGEIKWKGIVTGGGKLNVTGTGTLELGGTNSFTGDVTVKGNSTLKLNTATGLSTKVVILQENGIFRMGGDNMKAASSFDVQGGQLIMDKTGANVGNVAVKGGKLEMSFAGVKAGEVRVSGGSANISADATFVKLGISGGATNITAGILSVADSQINLSGTGLLKFVGEGNVASGMLVNTTGATSTAELGQSSYNFKLKGTGVLKVNDPALKSSYKGDSSEFSGRVDVLAGQLTLESQMMQATANVSGTGDSAGLLIFTGATEQVKALQGTGRVSFSNSAVNITSTSLFAGFNGMLVIGEKLTKATNQVKFSYNGASLLGLGTTLLFTGNNGELTLNNTGSIFRESVSNVIMETNGVIHLTGSGMELRLKGDSWKGITEEKLPLLIFDMEDADSNFVYVDPNANELDINRLRIRTEEGLTVSVVKDVDGKLVADVPTELTVHEGGSLVQSYTLSADHSPSGNHELTGHTSVRSLSITSSDTGTKKNTGLVLNPGVKLSIALGEIYIAGEAAYAISGGSMGFYSKPAEDHLAHFYIVQDAKGGATVSTTLDETVYTFRKSGSEELVMTGELKNRGGVQVDSGRLVLTGKSQKYEGAGLTNKGELVLGDGKTVYTVNYSKLTTTAAGVTTFSEKSIIHKGFLVDNAGQLHMQMGAVTGFDTAFTGKGTTLIENKTHITLPQGSQQSFTVENGSSLTVNLSAAGSPGATMKGKGEINLVNTTGGDLTLSSENMATTSWLGFTGTLEMVSDQAMSLNLSLMGEGASVLVSKGGTLNDIATESTTRKYHVTLGDRATWKLADGAVYGGTLALGGTGTLTQTGVAIYSGDISGASLLVQGGTLTMGGNNSHEATGVGENTTVIGISGNAFGKSLLLNTVGSLAQINGQVTVGSLMVSAETGRLEILKDRKLTVTGSSDFRGILTGAGELNLESSATLAGVANDFTGNLNLSGGGQYDLTVSDMGTAAINVSGMNTSLNISGNLALGNNIITMGGGSTLSGGASFGGRLNITGTDSVTANGVLNIDSLHMLTPQAKLVVSGDLNVSNGGSFLLSDHNIQGAFGAIVSSGGIVSINGVFGVDLDVNNSFLGGAETNIYQLFKGVNGLIVNAPDVDINGGKPVRFDLDISMREFFTLNQETFTSSGIISMSRKEMTCYLLDPSYVAEDGMYADGFRSPNSTSYLGANDKNDGMNYPEVFFYEKSYTIGDGDNAYRLTNGDAWMNFHVAMTDQQLNAPTKLVVRDNWMSKTENAGGVILSVRGNADNTYSGGTQIFQAKVKVDGTLNKEGTGTMSAGDVYFFGTGSVEAIGEKAEISLNTGGDGSSAEYLFYNDFQLQQGAVITQTSSKNVLMGNLTVKDYGTLVNLTNEDFVLSGSRLNANNLKLRGAGGSEINTIRLEGIKGDKVNAKFTTVDIDRQGQLDVGRNATANITSLYLDKGSSVTMTEGGVLAVKQIKNGANGRGEVILAGGTFKAMGDFSITENGATYSVTSASTFDTNGYYMEINQYLTDWNDFTVTGGGKMLLVKDLTSFDSHATITGTSTSVTISKDKTLAGMWTVKDGGTLKTEENVSIRGTLNMEKGGFTDFGVGTKMDMATLNFKSGSTYAGFLKGEGSTVNFENGSHFQVKTEDLRKLTDGTEKALLCATTVNILNGKGFFNFSGGDGIINEAIIDSGKEKTLIIGTEELNVGGLGTAETRSGALGVTASELTAEQLAAMVGETNYRWLSFVLTADEVGDTGSKINVTVTRNVNFSELAETSNEVAIAPVISHIGMEGGKADSKLQGEELNKLGLALTKATGDAHQMLSNISLSTSSVMAGYSVQRENLRRHTLELRDRAVQERPCALRNQYETLENTVWASGQGGTYSVDGDNNAVGHTTSLWGGQLGVSRCVNENLVMGLAFTYTSSDINLDQGMGKATSDAYYIDLYAKYHKDNWNVTGILTGGFTDLETERNMSIEGYSSRTKGSSSGNQLMGMVEVGYEIDLDGDRSNIIEPFAALTAGYSSIDGFEETGAGSAGLNVASQSDTSCSMGAGVRYVKEFSTSSDELLRGRFEVRAMILQDLTDNEVDVEARFIGANGHSFSQKSTEIGKTGFLLGTGVVIPTSVNFALFADLNGEFRSSETGCNANIGVKYSF